MKKILFFLLMMATISYGQINPVAAGIDSTTFNFGHVDTTVRYLYEWGTAIDTVALDTAGIDSNIWQIGSTSKLVFTGGAGTVNGIMTDTSGNYPVPANAWFKIVLAHSFNPIITFWHRYQFDSLKAGGIVEYSQDSGISWKNVGVCPSLEKYNMYGELDTLNDGEPAFTGNSNSGLMSQFFFFNCMGERTTSTSCYPDWSLMGTWPTPPVWIRFRIVADSSAIPMAGWIIDSIKIADHYCPGLVKPKTPLSTSITPNPANNFLVIESPDNIDQIEVLNMTGQQLLAKSGINSQKSDLNISSLPVGFYFVRVNGIMAGRFLKY